MDPLGPMDPEILAEAAALSERLTQEEERRLAQEDAQIRPGPEDTDTCRICRGEGSPTEPLFYPCKCSGSIKFVHQDCLMEWLSHSQKKYCELCKTPFRFTKLYHPQMPRTIPTTVFLKKALWHVLVHLMTWLRALLVITVWLVCLPWAMRSGWRFLFWLADAGWARDRVYAASLLENTAPTRGLTVSGLPSNITQLVSVPAPIAIFVRFLQLTDLLPAFALIKSLVKGLIRPFFASEIPNSIGLQNGLNSTTAPLREHPEHASLLSEIPFLVGFSPYPAFNNVVIHVLEGLCITIGVVVAFILIFLIREWVVQQQPALDLAAAADLNNALAQAGGHAHDQHPGQGAEPALDAQHGVQVANDDENTMQRPIDGFQSSSGDPQPEIEQRVDEDVASIDSGPHTKTKARDQDPRWTELFNTLPRILQYPPVATSKLAIHMMTNEERNLLDRFVILARQEELLDTVLATSVESHAMWDSNEVKVKHQELVRALDEFFDPRLYLAFLNETGVADERTGIALGDKSQETSEMSDWKGKGRALDGDKPDPGSLEHALDLRDRHKDGNEGWQVLEDNEDSMHPFDATSNGSLDPERKSNGTIDPDLEVISPDSPLLLDRMTESDVDLATDANELIQPEQSTIPSSTLGPDPENTGLLRQVFIWFWGDVPPPTEADLEVQAGEDDGHIVEDVDQEPPFVPLVGALPIDMPPAEGGANVGNGGQAPVQMQDPEVAAAAAEAGIDVDQEAIEDAEDLEGILELIGMQGPVVQLFQNAIFSAVLVITSILIAVFVPYLWGKLVLLCLATPRLFIQIPVTMSLQFANVVADIIITLSCTLMYGIIWFYQQLTQTAVLKDTASFAGHMITQSWPRLQDVGMYVLASHESNDLLDASILSHYALRELRTRNKEYLESVTGALVKLSQAISTSGVFATTCKAVKHAPPLITGLVHQSYDFVQSFSRDSIAEFLIDSPPVGPADFDLRLAYWSPGDRALAVIAGYGFVAVLGALYLAQLAPLTTATRWRRAENVLIEFLTQAGGVLKVIFIIGIEMIVFPLFCGFLLDLALLPLFEDASTVTRLMFTLNAPWTSGFVHWFVGTCYMFHFALFVSMCRKIMRKGVLYFIRDPDDPTFHPVRDVLERSVAIQLRKIAFSAIVYGALITICLGGVVWGLWTVGTAYSVLPIHWSSTESALEFPLDILFYSFLTPVVLRAAKPSDALHEMYKHWFHRCARALRLSSFLFGEEYGDEKGRPAGKTWLQRFLSQVDDDPIDATINASSTQEDSDQSADPALTPPVPILSGRYVRAPNSDQLRPPKGGPVFIELDTHGKRKDGQPDLPESDPNSTMTAIVYIPPFFKLRIGLFVAAIWLYAALTGVGITIGPLLLGRVLIKSFMPEHAKVNDIYAFSLGIYIFGAAIWLALNVRDLFFTLRDSISTNLSVSALANRLNIIRAHTVQALSLVYVYGTAAFILPFLFAILVELYLLLPFHIFFGPPGENRHVVNLVQDWTLGFLYARIGARILHWNGGVGARGADVLARAFRAVVRDGYWHPDARLATRYFVLPFVLVFAVAALAPFGVAAVVNRLAFAEASAITRVKVIRLAYPVLLGSGLAVWSWVILLKAVRRWKSVVRDEVYLIGERLHNFGEKRARGAAALTAKESRAVDVLVDT